MHVLICAPATDALRVGKEEEHGMEWIIRGNKVLYVGSFNGEDPMGDFSLKNEWNYA